MSEELKNAIGIGLSIIFGGTIIVLLLTGGVVGCSKLNIKLSHWDGEADLAKAQSTRKIAVLEAIAHKESAKELAFAEIERARGVAEANKIIGNSLKGNDSYLRYLWIQNLANEKNQVIYVPTEANLPLLEASRLNRGSK